MAIYEILASSTSEIQGITCFIIQLFIAEAMFFFHLKKRKRFWLRLLVGGTACLLLGVTLPIIIGQYISGIRTFIVLVFMQLYMWFCFRRSFLDILFFSFLFFLSKLDLLFYLFFTSKIISITFSLTCPIVKFVVSTITASSAIFKAPTGLCMSL